MAASDDRTQAPSRKTTYHASQRCIVAAEHAIAAGDPWAAARELRQAAALQRAFVAELPPSQPRAREVFSRSADVLEQQADALTASVVLLVGPPGGGVAGVFEWHGERHHVVAEAIHRVVSKRVRRHMKEER